MLSGRGATVAAAIAVFLLATVVITRALIVSLGIFACHDFIALLTLQLRRRRRTRGFIITRHVFIHWFSQEVKVNGRRRNLVQLHVLNRAFLFLLFLFRLFLLITRSTSVLVLARLGVLTAAVTLVVTMMAATACTA